MRVGVHARVRRKALMIPQATAGAEPELKAEQSTLSRANGTMEDCLCARVGCVGAREHVHARRCVRVGGFVLMARRRSGWTDWWQRRMAWDGDCADNQ